jgi:hypothetical protein
MSSADLKQPLTVLFFVGLLLMATAAVVGRGLPTKLRVAGLVVVVGELGIWLVVTFVLNQPAR